MRKDTNLIEMRLEVGVKLDLTEDCDRNCSIMRIARFAVKLEMRRSSSSINPCDSSGQAQRVRRVVAMRKCLVLQNVLEREAIDGISIMVFVGFETWAEHMCFEQPRARKREALPCEYPENTLEIGPRWID